ncbi:uncharacterized protein si:cabz01007802.1 [Cheilinus undulatus]|uniref:uncharacterized protein si:cabz01007802.1 n=1 Tax=Cheilinus undulatus TaxID=241271 RepID=UPI001BD2D526|nr:uncharacterized protein si:cabz01007802.1 [Cheilinus undulatus]
MYMFKRDKGSATSPAAPPRPSKEELDNPTKHSLSRPDAEVLEASQENNSEVTSELNPKTKRSGVMGVMNKVNPFKYTSQAPSTVSKAPSSESLEQGPDSTQNPGMLRGVMQKVNPFKSTSQVPKAPSSESLEQGKVSESKQNPNMFKEMMQKANPYKPLPLEVANEQNKSADRQETTKETEVKENPGTFAGMMQKVNPFKSSQPKPLNNELSSSSGSLTDNNNVPEKQNPGMFKDMMQKVNPFKPFAQQAPKSDPQSDSADPPEIRIEPEAKENPGKFSGMMQKVNPFKSTAPKDSQPLNNELSSSTGSLTDNNNMPEKQNSGAFAGMIQKVNPFKSSQPKDPQPLNNELSSSSGNLTDNNNVPEKQNPGMFKGMMQRVNPFRSYTQMQEEECETDSVAPKTDSSSKTQEPKTLQKELSTSTESLDDSTIERHSIWYTDSDASSEVKSQPTEVPKKRTMTFRIKRILPSALFGSGAKEPDSASPDSQEPTQEAAVEVQTLELAEIPVPSEGTVVDPLDDEEGLVAWWRTVEGWDEWNQANQDDDAEEVVEQAADRVFMAARLFVRFFNQRGASLQQRILELLSLADAADAFHKKTVSASVGGGVASVAGSITTITGLILAPFTAGTSLIVTAVGIGVATAGGVTSASANITDTVHSKTDRKKVEKMIQDYEEEMRDIKECLEFLQEGMETLEEWNFEQYAESISKKHLNQNVKHVMKEGGRAGKALVINTESLISTVQVLGAAGSAAKAAQVMSVTTGVMSGLFLALDVFFLAKDSVELKKGAKTEFAAKIREVCKDLQDGLLELNRIKEELQRTMDGVEVEIQEEEEDEETLKSDLKKLIELKE